MASSSTSSIHKSSFKYDVFLSFRGEDTRTSFVDHLYHALKRENIETYKDDKNLEKGKRISKELIEAIKDSRFHVIVFSKNYASSSWCLDEVVEIMECQKWQTEHIVYPIFYDVEPTEVRKQIGEFGKAFAKHAKVEAAEKWREALVEATSFSGRDLRTTADRHEAEFIKLVVKEISMKLPSLSADDGLIGMRTRINHVVSSLNTLRDEFCMIGIRGMGGSGKTTLARAVFDQICNDFEGSSFVENVREVSKSLSLGLKWLQQQVLRDVLNDQGIIVNGIFEGKKMMKKNMPSRKVLVVLDDVDHIDQLKALAGDPNWFMKGSIIIITTRDKQVLVAHKVNLIHDVNLLTNDEAICLLSRCAFGMEIPIPGYEELLGKVVSYAAGLPLTITILGSSLCGENEHVWIDTIKRLEKIPLDETLQKLELSYMGLDTDCKEIFLDIACLLKGLKEDEAIRVLESRGFHAIHGLSVLEKKSLITISRDGYLDMHDHIQEMGRYIVRHSNFDEPRRHTRLWIQEEIIEILAKDLGTTEAITCIYLFAPLPQIINPETLMKGLGKMEKLRLLYVYFYIFHTSWKFDEVGEYFPNSLQYLNWFGYPFCSLPKTFHASNLVGLEMMYGNLVQLWQGGERKALDKLRFLNLRHSKLRTFDLGLTPNLEMLDLRGCCDLVELHMHVGCPKLKSLKLSRSELSNLDLRLTPNIETLNLEIVDLVELDMPHECPQLKSLNLSCPQLRSLNLDDLVLPKLEYLKLNHSKLRTPKLTLNLKTLILKNCDLVELHIPGGGVELESLDIKRCSELKTLCLGRTPNLERLRLEECSKLVKLHAPVGGLKKFTCLIYQGILRFKRFSIVGENGLLPTLDLTAESVDTCALHPNNTFPMFQFNCWYIEDLPSSTGNIEKLLAVGFSCACADLQSFFGNICGLQNLTKLTLSGNIPEVPEDLERLQCLEELHLFSTSIKLLPDSIYMLKHLKCLNLNSCWLLEKLPEDLGRLQCLEKLTLTWTQIKHLPDSICMLKHLKNLTLDYCMLLEKLPEDLGRLECLEELNLTSTEIKHLPDSICMLKHMKVLRLDNFTCLEKLPEDLGHLECLETLMLEECRLLRDIPNSICGMKRLKYFRLRYCNTVEELPRELGHLECLKELNIEELLESFKLPFEIERCFYTPRELDELFPFMTHTSEDNYEQLAATSKAKEDSRKYLLDSNPDLKPAAASAVS
ncbi:hypothetical protein OSB04_016447 [Centaurea solstitialis]|uniref:TIR domain-containing protein n=1 Tax=Centaurea solstitialis TaxID=347529 RepID=A0AA38TJ43_9ASTR|nr:hypothetical protein OSB04_016447 [Centaurea solstitialis]